MKYQVESVKNVLQQFTKTVPAEKEGDEPKKVLIQPTGVFSKPQGVKHKGFSNFDKIEVEILDTDSQTQITEKQNAAAEEFVKSKYPDHK